MKKVRKKLIESDELWQHKLLTCQELCKFCKERKIRISNYNSIRKLWHLSLIRADLVQSDHEINIEGLKFVCKKQDTYQYLDLRELPKREKGYGGSFSDINFIDGVVPYFHPYRFLVLFHVVRLFSSHINSTQFLSSPQGTIELASQENEYLTKFTSSSKICELFNLWNKISEAAIILEPYSYGDVYGRINCSFHDSLETAKKKLSKYRIFINKIITLEDQHVFEEYRRKLCISAEEIDNNKRLHVLLRLTSWHKDNKLQGAIGGSMVLLSMAEVIRRPLEKALSIELPEEDELGFGAWMKGARKMVYGSERVLDAQKQEIKDFLVEAGLDFGIKARCYLEGEIELGALNYALGKINGVQFINLKGQVVEKKGKGLSFRNSLEADLKAGIFSFIILDADRADFVRVVKKASKEQVFHGAFYLSTPDFEFENFSSRELTEVYFRLSKQNGMALENKNEIIEKTSSTKTNGNFFKALKQAGADDSITKGEQWGAALMEYAFEKNKDCQIITAAQQILRSLRVKFHRSLEKEKIDSNTGKLVERELYK